MDFVSGFPLTQQKHDSIWVIVDRLIKSAHFIPIRIDYSMDRLAELYMDEIVRFHGVSLSIIVRAPPPGPLRRGVVPLTGYRGMSHALFFRLRESSNPRPNGHIEMGSTLTTNWASSPVGSESAPHFNMSLWSWVRALTEAKEKGMGHAPIACEWDNPSSEWARGWGPYKKRRLFL